MHTNSHRFKLKHNSLCREEVDTHTKEESHNAIMRSTCGCKRLVVALGQDRVIR